MVSRFWEPRLRDERVVVADERALRVFFADEVRRRRVFFAMEPI
jgi:hypothetical protein